MAEENTPQQSKASGSESGGADNKPAPSAKPAAGATATKAKKEKPAALEDKPFQEFIEQHYLPSLSTALDNAGLAGVALSFQNSPLSVAGADDSTTYWQVVGKWPAKNRQFTVVFTKEDITGPKFYYYADGGQQASTIEQFMGDERKITLDLMVLYTLQRLNGQKWLTRN